MASFQTILYQFVLAMMRDSEFTSASPGHINHFIGTHGIPSGIGTDDEIREALAGIINSESKGESTDNLTSDLLDAEGKSKKDKTTYERDIAKMTGQGIGAVNNPAGMAMSMVQYMPHAAVVMLAASLAPLIFEELTRPGGKLDLRFKRILEDETVAFLSRQMQKDTEMGVRQVVIQGRHGFTALNGENQYNTIRGIREGGINPERQRRLSLTDHAKGLF